MGFRPVIPSLFDAHAGAGPGVKAAIEAATEQSDTALLDEARARGCRGFRAKAALERAAFLYVSAGVRLYDVNTSVWDPIPEPTTNRSWEIGQA